MAPHYCLALAAVLISMVSSLPLLASALPPRTCRPELTSLAALSCQESPQAPTASCCNALLYAIHSVPASSADDRGLCCLCVYMASTEQLDYDLATLYSSCGGKHASEATAWIASAHTPFDCNDVCHAGLPSPPPPSTSTEGSEAGKEGGGKEGTATVVVLIVVVGVVVAAIVLLVSGACFYYRRPSSAKARESPATTDSDSDESSPGDMSSLGRRSTSQLI